MAMTGEIRAITVWQPWASLQSVPIGYTPKGRPRFAKNYETRSWATDYRGPIAIHAAAKPARECLREIRDPRALREICTALIPILYRGDPPKGIGWQDVAADLERNLHALPRRAVICTGELVDCVKITPELLHKIGPRELALGNWEIGGYAWKIAHKRPCVPVAVNGAQGLWRWR